LRALLARHAHKSRVGEKKFATDSDFAKKRDGRLGGAHGPARRSPPAFDTLAEVVRKAVKGSGSVSGVHNDN
jgi:hypothetical protein